MGYSTDRIRNVAIAGHGVTGKTTLFEHILFSGGVIQKPESVESGKTVSDYSDEEVERKISVHSAFAHLNWEDTKINFIDTPGSSDFIGEVLSSFRACEMAIVLVDARAGVQIETVKLWRHLNEAKKPRIIFIDKMDGERADFEKTLADVKEKLKGEFVPLCVPMGNAVDFKGVIDVFERKSFAVPADGQKESPADVPAEYAESVEKFRQELAEAAAEGDDELLMKYLETGSMSDGDVRKGLASAFRANMIVPIFAGSGLKNSGILGLLDFIAEMGPDPTIGQEILFAKDETMKAVQISPDQPFSAFVIKTAIDQFSGKLSFIKVITGRLAHDTEIYNVKETRKEKVGKIYAAQGKKLEEIQELVAGDIGILTKLQSVRTNDTITVQETTSTYRPLILPTPTHRSAINAKSKKEEDKLGELLVRAAEEDPTFRIAFNPETKETVISGMGELQTAIILDKIRKGQKIEMETHVPRVAYRETIRKSAAAEYTHKKQTGGHGQYAKVSLEIKPLPRGGTYKFENKVFGGAISKGYIPGVEKGVQMALESGILAGYPVVDVEVAVTDGKEHPVDSSELAFKLASRGAFRDAAKNAQAVLLEPIMNLSVFVDDQYLGDVMSDLSGRRGKIQGENSIGGGIQEIKAQVPLSELLRYSIDLRSITSGTASFEIEFSHYQELTGKLADDVIKNAEAFRVKEEEE
jgi:elongation factor G